MRRLAGRTAFALLVTPIPLTGCLDRPVSPLSPATSNVFVDDLVQRSVEKIDLLFVVDNSASMADKQQILGSAVPDLLERLVNPPCMVLDATGRVTEVHRVSGHDAPCPVGQREFPPVRDLHVGVITSSLGGQGGDVCTPAGPAFHSTMDDRAHLVTRQGDGTQSSTPGGLPFLEWAPGTGGTVDSLTDSFRSLVTGAGQEGCGFEATLESWYRFLVDPEPPARIVRGPCGPNDTQSACAFAEGIDEEILAQRAAFLRPDSLVAIVMLSDENDCSVADGGQGWVTTQSRGIALPRASAACSSGPSDPCCRPCGLPVPNGCAADAVDAECSKGPLVPSEDPLNLRCFEQKRRFGIDFLHATDRYVRGLTSSMVPRRDGTLVPNPMFSRARDPSFGLVFLAGIVGVPWQDLAKPEATTDRDLVYLTAAELEERGQWSVVLGNSRTGAPPSDPLMIESVPERSGASPAGGALQPSTAPSPVTGVANGHEWNVARGDDLQYACIFPVERPYDCAATSASCDCSGGAQRVADERKPLCQDPATGAYGSVQHFAKAYPGTRHLEVLRGVGDQAIVASICARNVHDRDADDYGYRPAMRAVADRLRDALLDRCLPRPLDVAADGDVPCAIVEARVLEPGEACTCTGVARRPVSDQVAPVVARRLVKNERCGGDTGRSCTEFCACEITPAGTGVGGVLDPAAQAACRAEPTPGPGIDGWCYVDPGVTSRAGTAEETAQRALAGKCDRKLRFVGEGRAESGATLFMACAGDTFVETP